MNEWYENEEIEIVDVDLDDTIQEADDLEVMYDLNDSSSGTQSVSGWEKLSDEEMQRRGDALGKRLELQEDLRDMRLFDLEHGEYGKDLFEEGEPLDLSEDVSVPSIQELCETDNEEEPLGELDAPSDLERLKTLKELIEERDPETCRLLEEMNIDYHDLKTRAAGHQRFVEFHLDVPPHDTIETIHRQCDIIEERLEREFTDINVIIHPEPK